MTASARSVSHATATHWTIAIIPARGGSTRIPGKNLALLGGKPLISYTIEAALATPGIDDVFVSTNDADIAAVAKHFGAQVVVRPDDLATAISPTEPALFHTVQTVEQHVQRQTTRIVMLQPTSPLRTADRIDQGLRLMQRTGCDSVVSVVRDVSYYFLGDIGEGNRLNMGYDPNNRLRTQDIPPRYRENGAIYIMTREQLMARRCRMGGDMRALVMDDRESIDIDTMLDLQHCELLLPKAPTSTERRTPRPSAHLHAI